MPAPFCAFSTRPHPSALGCRSFSSAFPPAPERKDDSGASECSTGSDGYTGSRISRLGDAAYFSLGFAVGLFGLRPARRNLLAIVHGLARCIQILVRYNFLPIAIEGLEDNYPLPVDSGARNLERHGDSIVCLCGDKLLRHLNGISFRVEDRLAALGVHECAVKLVACTGSKPLKGHNVHDAGTLLDLALVPAGLLVCCGCLDGRHALLAVVYGTQVKDGVVTRLGELGGELEGDELTPAIGVAP